MAEPTPLFVGLDVHKDSIAVAHAGFFIFFFFFFLFPWVTGEGEKFWGGGGDLPPRRGPKKAPPPY